MICERKVKKFCCEDISKIENYDKAIADTTQTWDCHHRMQLIATGAVVDSTAQDLIDWGIYYNRPADELIFLTRKEHNALHNKGKHHSEEAKLKISDAKKGKPSWNKGKHTGQTPWIKGKHLSEEAKQKMSEAKKGRHWKLVDGKRVWYQI